MSKGRKSKLTKELIEDAREMLEAGNYANTVAAALGIGQTTWYRWLEEAEEPKASALKREFRDMVEASTAMAEVEYVDCIKAAKDGGDWRAAMAWLERKLNDRWGRVDRHKHSGDEGGEAIPILVVKKEGDDGE